MNKVKPEIEVELGGEKRIVVFNHNATFALEETEGANFIVEAAQEIGGQKLSLRKLIVLLWAGLITHNEEFDVRQEDELRAVRRKIALWLTDANVHLLATVAVVQALVNSTVIARDDDGSPISAKKEKPSPETGSEI